MKTRSQTPRVDTTNDVFTYLTTGKYPHGANDNAKRNIRKRAKYFKLKDGELYHLSTTQDNYGNDVARERIVLWDEEERLRKIKEMHIDEAGNHLGRQNLIAKLSKTYYFVGISSKVKQVIQECGLCLSRMRSGSISDGNVSTLSSDVDLDDSDSVISFSEDKPIKSEWPTRSQEALHFWEIVELGVLGPFDCIDSKHYIIVFLDLFSNWPEAFVVDSLSPSVVTHLILNLICRFGCMKTLMIRDHPGFLKDDLTPQQEILQKTGLQITVNQFPSSLSDKTWTEIDENLQNYTENNSHWPHCLEFALMPHRISRAERSEYTPAFITYGRELNLPSDLLKEGSRDESFPSAEPHLSCEDMARITSKFLKAYTTYGKNFQAWNSCSQPFCVIPSMNSENIQSTPRRKKRGKDVSENNSDKEAEEDMPPPATDYRSPGKEPNRKRRKRSVSSITRLINADESMDEDEAEPQDPKDKDYTPPNKKMNKVNSEKDAEIPEKPKVIIKLTPPTPKKHICNGCGKEFSRSDVLRRHIREMHETHESMINICPECGICIKRKHHLARHIKQVHSKGCECKACGELFGNKVELKEHISTAHDGYNCEKCNRNYTSKSGLKFHIAQEHEQKYPCPICGKSSGSSSSFNKHLASHTEGADIKCPHCRYSFPNKEMFLEHREACRQARAYTCGHCGKGFPSKNSFQHHEATHFDGKFPCHVCGIKFSFSTNLNRHIRTVHSKILEKSDTDPTKEIENTSISEEFRKDVEKLISLSEPTKPVLFADGTTGMDENHTNSLNQIVEAIKIQVERRIEAAGYASTETNAGQPKVIHPLNSNPVNDRGIEKNQAGETTLDSSFQKKNTEEQTLSKETVSVQTKLYADESRDTSDSIGPEGDSAKSKPAYTSKTSDWMPLSDGESYRIIRSDVGKDMNKINMNLPATQTATSQTVITQSQAGLKKTVPITVHEVVLPKVVNTYSLASQPEASTTDTARILESNTKSYSNGAVVSDTHNVNPPVPQKPFTDIVQKALQHSRVASDPSHSLAQRSVASDRVLVPEQSVLTTMQNVLPEPHYTTHIRHPQPQLQSGVTANLAQRPETHANIIMGSSQTLQSLPSNTRNLVTTYILQKSASAESSDTSSTNQQSMSSTPHVTTYIVQRKEPNLPENVDYVPRVETIPQPNIETQIVDSSLSDQHTVISGDDIQTSIAYAVNTETVDLPDSFSDVIPDTDQNIHTSLSEETVVDSVTISPHIEPTDEYSGVTGEDSQKTLPEDHGNVTSSDQQKSLPESFTSDVSQNVQNLMQLADQPSGDVTVINVNLESVDHANP